MLNTLYPCLQLVCLVCFNSKNILYIKKGLWTIIICVLLLQILFPHVLLAQSSITAEQTSKQAARLEDKKMIFVEARRGMTVPKQYKTVQRGYVLMTAYSSTIDQTDSTPFITANGKYVYDGLIAANFLPYNTKVRFPDYFGDKIFTVDDRMNSRYRHRIDVWMPTRQDALQFGVRYLEFEIIIEI